MITLYGELVGSELSLGENNWLGRLAQQALKRGKVITRIGW